MTDWTVAETSVGVPDEIENFSGHYCEQYCAEEFDVGDADCLDDCYSCFA